MKRTMMVLLAAGAMLCCTLSVQAVPQLGKGSIHMAERDFAPGQAPNSGSIDDDCTTGGFALGVLAPFMSIPADTSGLLNDFLCDPICTGPCDFAGVCSAYGAGGLDGVATFTVPTTGMWTFSSCGNVHDSSLAIREGGACPGTTCVAQDDDSCAGCAAPYSAVASAALTAGTTYYLIVDAFGSGGVTDLIVTGPCTVAGDCDDGVFCNGAEDCPAGMCEAGTAPCSGSTPICDEAADSCSGCSADPSVCLDDALFCNGVGACLLSGACGQSGNPCDVWQSCNEGTNACDDPDPCTAWDNRVAPFGFISRQRSNCCGDMGQGDDIQLSAHAGRTLNYYESMGHSRPFTTGTCPNGDPAPPAGTCAFAAQGVAYTLRMSLYTVSSGGLCSADTEIPDSVCNVTHATYPVGGFLPSVVGPPSPTDATRIYRCNAAMGMGPGAVVIPDGDDDPTTGQCGVDVYMVVTAVGPGKDTHSALIGNVGPEQTIGGPALDDEITGGGAWLFPNCSLTGVWDGTWGFGGFGAGFINDHADTVFCTEPIGPCCAGDGTCSMETDADCAAAGGTYLGDNTLSDPKTCDSPDGDGDDVRDECDGCPMDIDKVVPGQCGCGNSDLDSDGDGTANCNDLCPNDAGKIVPGICGCGIADTDSDGDLTADCQDLCDDDPNKVVPGICGCGVAETGDTDGDGYLDCVDLCPGVDDDVFFPGCQGAIPTVSEWGMVALALLLLVGAKVYFGRRQVQA